MVPLTDVVSSLHVCVFCMFVFVFVSQGCRRPLQRHRKKRGASEVESVEVGLWLSRVQQGAGRDKKAASSRDQGDNLQNGVFRDIMKGGTIAKFSF